LRSALIGTLHGRPSAVQASSTQHGLLIGSALICDGLDLVCCPDFECSEYPEYHKYPEYRLELDAAQRVYHPIRCAHTYPHLRRRVIESAQCTNCAVAQIAP
jgi:hypothetical protein